MPIPKPNPKEPEADYVARCMAAIGGEYEDKKQAVAVCHSTYREAKKEEDAQTVSTESPVKLRAGDQPLAGHYEELSPEDLPPHLRRRDLRPDDLELKEP